MTDIVVTLKTKRDQLSKEDAWWHLLDMAITEIERLRDERTQIAFKIIEDEARLSKARRYVVRVDGTKENSDE